MRPLRRVRLSVLEEAPEAFAEVYRAYELERAIIQLNWSYTDWDPVRRYHATICREVPDSCTTPRAL
jgi:hypothetical protein